MVSFLWGSRGSQNLPASNFPQVKTNTWWLETPLLGVIFRSFCQHDESSLIMHAYIISFVEPHPSFGGVSPMRHSCLSWWTMGAYWSPGNPKQSCSGGATSPPPPHPHLRLGYWPPKKNAGVRQILNLKSINQFWRTSSWWNGGQCHSGSSPWQPPGHHDQTDAYLHLCVHPAQTSYPWFYFHGMTDQSTLWLQDSMQYRVIVACP